MTSMETLNKSWREKSGMAFHAKPVVTDDGILFGVGTVLVRKIGDGFDVASDAERAIGLLSIAKRGAVEPRLLHYFHNAALAWTRGEKALAQFHLAYARIAPLESREDAKRLFLAEAVIAAGVPPLQLARMVGAGPAEIGKGGYNFDESRNPKDDGHLSGEWTDGPGDGNEPEHTITVHPHPAFAPPTAPPPPPPPSLIGKILSKEARAFLIATAKRGFGELVAGGVAGVVGIETFRTLFVPSPNDGVISRGELPGQPGGRYEANNESGTLTIDASGTGAYRPVVALLGQGGIYREVESGVMIAQHLGDGIVMLDPDVLATLDQPKSSGAPPPSGPKLCLDPISERGGSASPFAPIYQKFVRDYVNPQRIPQLPRTLTHVLPANTASGWVYFDDCRESNGNMIEAKSDQTGYMHSEEGQKNVAERYLDQARDQYNVLGARHAEWYFHRKENADFARQLFDENGLSDKISVYHLPYPGVIPDSKPRKKP